MTARPVMTSILVAVLLVGLFLTGCSLVEKTTDLAAENERVTEALIQNRTLAFIDGDPDRAQQVQQVAEQALELLDQDREGRLKELRQMAEEAIPWGRLSDQRATTLRGLLVVIEHGVAEHAGDGTRPNDEQELYLSTALEWVVEAAELVP